MSLANGNVTHILLDWAPGQRQSERQRYIAGKKQEERKRERKKCLRRYFRCSGKIIKHFYGLTPL